FGGGFGGGFGEKDEADDSDADGFGGGFGGDFGGDFGEEEEAGRGEEQERGGGGDEGGGRPPEGSLAAWLVDLIDTIKAHWADELLRQLVIICGFLGAMLAARRRSHITIDAVGTLLEGRARHIVDTLTSMAAGATCVFLALSGLRLVELGIEYPRELLPFAKQWQIQLVFPIGWSLLALHFIVRSIESAQLARTRQEDDEAVDSAPTSGPASTIDPADEEPG
ncbi:MAG: TRAP transporter small permease, partial [Persicimonas sp.]